MLGRVESSVPRDVESQGSALLAVRRAAWPLRHALLRSPHFDAMDTQIVAIDAEVASLGAELVQSLYARVPSAGTATNRRRLLAIKRAVFNHKHLPSDAAAISAQDDVELWSALRRYGELLQRRRAALDGTATVVDEVRRALAERASGLDFRLAVAASSSTLYARLESADHLPRAFSARDRSLYAYVCRFATKVNPLHLFTHLVPGAYLKLADHASRGPKSARCEIVFDVEDVLALEGRLLSGSVGAARVRLALCPMARKNGRWQLWLKREQGWCAATIANLPLIERLQELYAERSGQGSSRNFTRAELAERLLVGEDPAGAARMDAAIESLIERGLLRPYLMDDLASPARAMRDLDASVEPLLDCLERWHLARVSPRELPEIDRQLAAASADLADGVKLRYHVNSYADDDLGAAEEATRALIAPLTELKTVLTVEHNFSPVERVVEAFYREELREGARRPYLDLLATFLRHRLKIVERFSWGRETPQYEVLVQRCRSLSGRLEPEQLLELRSGIRTGPQRSVCFVGAFDYVERRFYLNNTFTGDRRFASRYLLTRGREATAPESSQRALDVELAVPPEHNLNFVVRRYDSGLGFDNRWAHGYRQWLEPAQIDVVLRDGEPIFLDSASGRQVRFQYRGFLLAQYLPIEYQLLLGKHADCYCNPFAEDPVPSRSGEVEHRAALEFGPVCLRREAWWAPTATVAQLLGDSDPVRATLSLRSWVRARLAPVDLWFYRLPNVGRHGEKPRLLDLASPLSTVAFRRALAGGSTYVALSPMEPVPDGLCQIDGEGYVAELMIEI